MGVSRGCRFNVSANSPFESFDELLVIERCYRLKFVGKEIFRENLKKQRRKIVEKL